MSPSEAVLAEPREQPSGKAAQAPSEDRCRRIGDAAGDVGGEGPRADGRAWGLWAALSAGDTGRWCPDEAELGAHLRAICPITATMLSRQPQTADALASAEA